MTLEEKLKEAYERNCKLNSDILELHRKIEKLEQELGHTWHRCHRCQLNRGAKVPKGGFLGITVTTGTCPSCKAKKVTLIPNRDYDWKGKK